MSSKWDKWSDFPDRPRPKPMPRPAPDPVPKEPKSKGDKK